MRGYGLFQMAKQNGKYTSDYELCKAIGVSMQSVNNWKNGKSKPGTITTLKLMREADLKVDEGLKLLEEGYARVSLLTVTAGLSVALLASRLTTDPLYIMLN